MIRVYLVLVTSIFIFSGCMGSLASYSVKPNVKVFEQEDSYILFALRAEQLRDYKSASELFNSLYEKADKKSIFIAHFKMIWHSKITKKL